MKSAINQRIKEISNILFNGNISEFARKTTVNQPTLRDIVGTKQVKPGFDTLSKIVENSTISAEWLLTGRGERLKNEYAVIENVAREEPAAYGNSWKDKYIAEIEENKQLRIEIRELETELFKIKEKTAVKGSGAKAAPTGTGGA